MIDNLLNTYRAFWIFIKNPLVDTEEVTGLSAKLKTFFQFLVLDLLLSLLLGVLLSQLRYLVSIPFQDHNVTSLLSNNSSFIGYSVFFILVPFTEELLFRLPLRLREKYIHWNVLLLFFGLSMPLSSFFRDKYLQMAILFCGLPLWLVCLVKKNQCNRFLLNLWNHHFFYVFYFSVVSFGVAHISNYKPALKVLLFLPLLVSPQLMMGLFLGYVRLKLGFLWSYFLHALHNFIVFLPLLLTSFFSYLQLPSVMIKEEIAYGNHMQISNGRIDIRGELIGDVISTIKGVRRENIEFEDSVIQKKILTIHSICKYRDKPGIKHDLGSLVLMRILEKYNLKIESQNLGKCFYNLQITDAKKLNQYLQGEDESLIPTMIPRFGDSSEIVLHYTDMELLSRTISLNFGTDLVFLGSNFRHYNIKIPKLELEELKKYMLDKYGIRFYQSGDKVYRYKIVHK